MDKKKSRGMFHKKMFEPSDESSMFKHKATTNEAKNIKEHQEKIKIIERKTKRVNPLINNRIYE